jgi:2-polyprenyl-3-methyl-5-hydroxy-6-metoxy-1,4-benzoquinol methylase
MVENSDTGPKPAINPLIVHWQSSVLFVTGLAIAAALIQLQLAIPVEQLPSPVTAFVLLNLALAAVFATIASFRRSCLVESRFDTAGFAVASLALFISWLTDWLTPYSTIADAGLMTSWALSVAMTLLFLRRQNLKSWQKTVLLVAIFFQGFAILADLFDDVELANVTARTGLEVSYALAVVIAAACYQLALFTMAFSPDEAVAADRSQTHRPRIEAGHKQGDQAALRKVERLLASGSFGYQQIRLADGRTTRGKSRESTLNKIFPESLQGKTVADVGCNHGLFCLAAVERGASDVLGLDLMPDIIKRARLLAKSKGLAARFEVHDINRSVLPGQFDYVLCLNVLHHARDPIAVIDDLVSNTRQRLVLEVAGLNLLDYVKRLHTVPLTAFLMAWSPVIYVGLMKNARRPRRPTAIKYYITRNAMRRILSRYNSSFREIRFQRSAYKGRYLVICDK